MLWLVIGLTLFRNQPIWYVIQQLQLVSVQQNTAFLVIRTGKTALRLRTYEYFIFDIKLDIKTHNNNMITFMVCTFVLWMVWFGQCLIQKKTLSTLVHPKGKQQLRLPTQVRATCLVNTNTHANFNFESGFQALKMDSLIWYSK